MTAHLDGEQLVLSLKDERLPWGGVSPRCLTRAYLERRFGGTGRANLDAELINPTKEVLQLWLCNDTGDLI